MRLPLLLLLLLLLLLGWDIEGGRAAEQGGVCEGEGGGGGGRGGLKPLELRFKLAPACA